VNVVDSSGWLEYFADGRNAGFFAPAIEDLPRLVIATLSPFEVFKRLLQQRGKATALQAMAPMHQGRIVDLDATLALAAARLSTHERLPSKGGTVPATSPAEASRRVRWRASNLAGRRVSAARRPRRAG
jgi:hypothetical protein